MRRPVLLVDYSSPASQKAIEILRSRNVDFVEYDIGKFEESCCGELPTTVAPSVFAPEGVFKGLEGVVQYASSERKSDLLKSQKAPTGKVCRNGQPAKGKGI